MEEWPSGRRRTPGKCVYCNRYQGFESPFFRQRYVYARRYRELIVATNIVMNILKKMSLMNFVVFLIKNFQKTTGYTIVE